MSEVLYEAYGCPPKIVSLVNACREGRVEKVREIVTGQGGAEAKWRPWGSEMWNPLMWAASEGQLGVVRALLEGESQNGLSERLDMRVSYPPF